MTNSVQSLRLNKNNLKHLEEIKTYFEANFLVQNNSINSEINFIINEFYRLFISNNSKKFIIQEGDYLNIKTKLVKQSRKAKWLDKFDSMDNNIELILYILLALNQNISVAKPDENGIMKSIISPGNSFNQWVQMAQNSINRDKYNLRMQKQEYN